LVEEGFEAVLIRKYNPNSAPRGIFDGAAEAKLIALACGPAPEGYARWTLSQLEEKVVELNIVEKASDNTIGRTLKKTRSSRISNSDARFALFNIRRDIPQNTAVGSIWPSPNSPSSQPNASAAAFPTSRG
jgi:hypothetical protein